MNETSYSPSRQPKVAFVSVESGIAALGFRRVAAVARTVAPQTDIFFIAVDNLYSLLGQIVPTKQTGFDTNDAEIAGKHLAEYDLICFSAMTASAKYVEAIISSIRMHNPSAFILYGGVHAILYSEDAMAVSDAICYNEGERPFELFYKAFAASEDYTATPGMWFKTPGGTIKNPSLTLNSNEELTAFPVPYAGLDCAIYDLRAKKFRPYTKFDYASYNGLTFRTVWSIGCPFSCTFCANDAFINLDKHYARLRYPTPEHLVQEIEAAISLYPHISNVAFYDDNFIALPKHIIQEFSNLYKTRINLPFVVFGIHPNTISQEKLDMLADAGVNRVRMGIQSGSARMLKFYNRGTLVDRIQSSASILAIAARKHKMIPPSYDIITDNPVEERDDIVETLQLLYDLERPYTITLFGLRVFPNTKLWQYFATHPAFGDPRNINTSYLDTRPTMGNVLLYLLGACKPPKRLFDWMLRRVKGYNEEQSIYPALHMIVKVAYLSKRALDHIKALDFTVIVGAWTYYVWKLGIIKRSRVRSSAKTA
ncbi:MAG: radical SAM protein [Capsulimonadaceae bacterium]|nr:radical SAM protein [Capsulimonadaceae bacterium]